MDICGIDFCLPSFQSHQNVIYSLVKIDSAPILIPTELSELAVLIKTTANLLKSKQYFSDLLRSKRNLRAQILSNQKNMLSKKIH